MTAKFEDGGRFAEGGSGAFWVELKPAECPQVREKVSKQHGEPDALGYWQGRGYHVALSDLMGCQLSVIGAEKR